MTHVAPAVQRTGILFGLVAAAAYSTSAIFARLAYADGVGLVTLLAARYVLAAVVFWALVLKLKLPLPARRPATAAFVLGLVVFSAQSGLFFAALQRISAPLAIMLLYAYPALVAVAAILLGRERPSVKRFSALAVATAGVALVLADGDAVTNDPLGVMLALGAAVMYTAYILVGHDLMRSVQPLVLAALTCSGAAATYVVVGLGTSTLDIEFSPLGWLALIGVGLIATVVAVGASFASVMRIGPTVASIIATAEIPLGVILAATILGERLGPIQLLGGALVVGAVLLVQAPRSRRSRREATPSSKASASSSAS